MGGVSDIRNCAASPVFSIFKDLTEADRPERTAGSSLFWKQSGRKRLSIVVREALPHVCLAFYKPAGKLIPKFNMSQIWWDRNILVPIDQRHSRDYQTGLSHHVCSRKKGLWGLCFCAQMWSITNTWPHAGRWAWAKLQSGWKAKPESACYVMLQLNNGAVLHACNTFSFCLSGLSNC